VLTDNLGRRIRLDKELKKGVGTSRNYIASVVGALLIWSTSFIGTKIAYASFPPITLGAARFVIASIVLGILVVLKKGLIKPEQKDMRFIAVSGILGITIYFTMENIGVKWTTAINAALIVASYPAITTLLELLVYKEKPSIYKIAGIVIAVAGVYLVSYTDNSIREKNQLAGNIILIATGIVWAFYNFTTRKVVNKYPAITLSFYQTVIGTACFIPLAFFEKDSWAIPTAISLSALIYLGVLCSVAAFMLYNFGLRKLSASTAVSLMNLVPIFGAVFSILILHESVSLRQVMGGAIVIAGVMLSMKRQKAVK
jgi:drug/metabolite transporter (DMT)-like permease